MGAAPRELEGLLFALDAETRCIAVSTLLHCRANLICCAVRNQQHAWTKAAAEAAGTENSTRAATEAADNVYVDSASLVRESAL